MPWRRSHKRNLGRSVWSLNILRYARGWPIRLKVTFRPVVVTLVNIVQGNVQRTTTHRSLGERLQISCRMSRFIKLSIVVILRAKIRVRNAGLLMVQELRDSRFCGIHKFGLFLRLLDARNRRFILGKTHLTSRLFLLAISSAAATSQQNAQEQQQASTCRRRYDIGYWKHLRFCSRSCSK